MGGELRQGKRTWIKLYTLECLEGSIRYQLNPDERGVWYDLLIFSAICRNDGIISDRDGRAFPHSFIANRLNISLDLLEVTLKKCQEEGRIKEDEKGIVILNWKRYQSEYSRLKKYREKVVMSGKEKVGMTRSLINQRPDIAIDVLAKDFGHRVVSRDGEILSKEGRPKLPKGGYTDDG